MVLPVDQRESREALEPRNTKNRICETTTEERSFGLGCFEPCQLRHAQREHREGSKTVGRCAETGAEGGKAFSVQDEAAQTFVGAKA